MLHNLHTALLASASIAATAYAAPAGAQLPGEVIYSIPAQDLSRSLREVSLKSGRNIIAPADLVQGRQAPAISGPFTAEGAVGMLLTGSGLEARAVGDSLVIVVAPAPAVAGNEAQPERDSDTIVVTGTHVRGAAPTSPTLTISREEIDRTGAASVAQLMRKVPQNFEGGINQENFRVTGAGADVTEHGAGVNLRGLGQRATLVLVNGRRLAPSGAGSFVDVSLIPITAVDRVEILLDGASAVYGSDAVGGVVNFILRSKFEGFETSLQAGTTTEGGGTQLTASATAGHAWKTGHAMLSYEFHREQPILTGERDYTINMPGQDALFPAERRHSLFGVVGQSLAPGLNLEVTGSYADRHTERSYFFAGVDIPVNAAAHARSTGLTGSLTYDLGGSWLAEVTGGYFLSKTHQRQEQPGGQGLVNLFDTRNALLDFGLKADGSLFSLPGGPLKVAFGAQSRREEYRDLFTTVGAPQVRTGARNVRALFAEAYLPIFSSANRLPGLERLVVTAAARYEHYEELGWSFNPKLGLLWSPVAGLTVRGSYDTSFRAPLLSEQGGFYNAFYFPAALLYLNPAQAPSGDTALATAGSNPGIRPERSRTWTLGAEFRPRGVPGLSLSANYYAIRFSNRIALPTSQIVVVGNPAFEPIITRLPTLQQVTAIVGGAASVRDFSGPGFTNGGATPSAVDIIVDARINNTAVTTTRGIDLEGRYDFSLAASRFSLQLNANHILSFDDQLTRASPVIPTLDTPYHPVGWRARGGASWSLGGWSANAFINHVAAYHDNRTNTVVPVDSFTTVDAGLSYAVAADSGTSWLRGSQISLNVQNLFDTPPPRLLPDPGSTRGVGYDPVNASGRGRFISIQLRKSW
ncbi:MAG TPA: TonB-dependent receptor [Allosphingosinicella sp.]|jgi:outer membrane receptor protein involved in Fe transport